jgi:hypothetical protein
LAFLGHEPKVVEHQLLAVAEGLKRKLRNKLPRMAPQHGGKPRHPLGREVALAKLEVADLLIGRANPLSQISEREAASLTQRTSPRVAIS